MDENLELLTHIYETADMGAYTITTLINKLKDKENKIKFMLEKEIKGYEKYINISGKLLEKNDIKPKKTSLMAKMGSNIGIMKETMKDNSEWELSEAGEKRLKDDLFKVLDNAEKNDPDPENKQKHTVKLQLEKWNR